MNTMMKKLLGYVGLILSLTWASQAGQYWWDANGDTAGLGGSGNWNTTTNLWRSPTSADPLTTWNNDGGAQEAVFTNTAGTVTLGATPIKANSMKFIGTGNWTLNGGTLDLGSNGSITHPNGALVTINSAITGSGTLFLTNSVGSWYSGVSLYGNNTNFTGKISMKQTGGSWLALVVTNDVNFGAVPVSYTADALKFEGGGLCNGSSPMSIATNRGITIVGYAVFSLNAGNINFNSIITGSGSLRAMNGAGTNYLNNLNTFTSTFDNNNANFAIGIDNALPHGTGKGEFHFYNGGTLNMNGHVATMNALGMTGNGWGTIDNLAAGPATLIVGDANGGSTANCTVKNTSGALSLTKIGTGTQTLSGPCTYTGTTTVNGGTLTISGTNSASSGMVVSNAGTLVISGFLSNAVPLTVNAGGTLRADLSVNTNGVFNSASVVTLAGGTLNIKGKNSGTSATALGNLNINLASSTVSLTPNGGSGTALTLGNTWTRSVGSTLLVDVSVAGSTVSSSPTLTNGIIGGYAMVKDATGTGFATTNASSNVVRYTGATLLDAAVAAGNLDGTVNYVVSANQTLSGGNATQTVNSVEIGPGNIKLSGVTNTLVISSGGLLLQTPSWIATDSNLEIKSGTNELQIYVNGGQGYVGKVSDGDYSTSLVKSGTGTLVLGVYAVWSYTGDTIINEGTMDQIMNNLPHGYGKGNLVVNANGTAGIYGSYVAINGLSNATAVGGIVKNNYTASSSDRLDLGNNNATASFSGTIQGLFGVIKSGNGTQTFSGANTYSGGTILSNGVLSVSSLNNIGGANAKVTFAGGTLRITGTTFTNFGAAPLTFTSAGGSVEIVEAGNTLTLTNNLASGTVLTKTGAGTLSLTGTQAGTITTDDPTKISFGSGQNFYNLGLTSGAVLSPAGSGTIGSFAVNNNLTLAGKLLVDVTASTNDMVTTGGTITLSAGATLELVNPLLLNRNKQYTLMTSVGSVGGSLTALNLPDRWKVVAVGNTVVLYYAHPGTMIRIF